MPLQLPVSARPATRRPLSAWRLATVLLAGILPAACGGGGDDGGPQQPAAIERAAGATTQSATVNTAVATAPAVRVLDGRGQPLAGAAVTFTVAAGGGSVTGGNATTNASGVATVGSWVLGQQAGANRLTATVANVAQGVTFEATGTAGAPAQLTRTAGDNLSATVGAAITPAPAVRVVDQFGNPVAGAAVAFTVASGSGTVSGATVTTGNDGTATVGGWTLGPRPGAQTLQAAVGSVTTVFTATANAGAAAALVPVGNDQIGQAFEAVATPVGVRVTDAQGNPIAGVPVTFAVAAGGGAITNATATSGADGVASAGTWTLGGTVGTQRLTATSGALSTAITATSQATITLLSPSNVSATVGTLVAAGDRPRVRLTNAAGRVIPGVTVRFAVGGLQNQDAVVDGGTQVTDANGEATLGSWRLGTSTRFANRLDITVPNSLVQPVIVNGGGIAEDPVTLAFTRPDEPITVARTSAIALVEVVLRDRFGNTVTDARASGRTVRLALTTANGATLSGNTVTQPIAGNGFVQFTNVAVDRAGTYTFTATVDGAPTITSAVSPQVTVTP